ncbi:MAG: rhomboid family intramembrane serine protease [Planctomycetes bacterium]|nr:rhomboid family intramembrane serine protease [Planctomycetota bacterium]
MLIPFADDQGPRRPTPVVWLICAAWLAVFVAAVAASPEAVARTHRELGLNTSAWWHAWFQLQRDEVRPGWASVVGLVRPLLTCWLLHGGVLHVLSNALALWLCGGRLESRFGSLRFAVFCIAAIVAAGLVEVQVDGPVDRDLLGGSGLAGATLAACLALRPITRARTIVLVAVVPVVVEVPLWVLALGWIAAQARPLSRLLDVGPSEPMSPAALGAGAVSGVVGAILLMALAPRARGAARAARVVRA